MNYDPKDFNAWEIRKNGKSLQPMMKALPSPFSLAYKKRAYSPNRIRYPMKRVDWDPDGERNTQNRGKSKYVRISWDEAFTRIAGGSSWFDMAVDIGTGGISTEEVRFKGAWKASRDGRLWRITAQIEVRDQHLEELKSRLRPVRHNPVFNWPDRGLATRGFLQWVSIF